MISCDGSGVVWAAELGALVVAQCSHKVWLTILCFFVTLQLRTKGESAMRCIQWNFSDKAIRAVTWSGPSNSTRFHFKGKDQIEAEGQRWGLSLDTRSDQMGLSSHQWQQQWVLRKMCGVTSMAGLRFFFFLGDARQCLKLINQIFAQILNLT